MSSTNPRPSHIEVALVQADKEHQKALTTLSQLQTQLHANRTKIATLAVELEMAQKEVEHYSRTIPHVERIRTRADKKLKELKERAERVAKELAAERLVQDYLEELQKDDEDGEKRLKEYLSEVLHRDVDGFGDSDTESEWSVLGASVGSIKSPPPAHATSDSDVPPNIVTSPIAPASLASSIHSAHLSPVSSQISAEPVSGHSTPPAMAESDTDDSSSDEAPAQVQEAEIPIMLSEVPVRQTTPETKQCVKTLIPTSREPPKPEKRTAVVHTPTTTRSISPPGVPVDNRSDTKPKPEDMQVALVSERQIVQCPVIKAPEPKPVEQKAPTTTTAGHIYPPAPPHSALVVAPTPVKPISLTLPSPPTSKLPPPPPPPPVPPKTFNWAPLVEKESQLVKYERRTPPTVPNKVDKPARLDSSDSDRDARQPPPPPAPKYSYPTSRIDSYAPPPSSSKRVPPPPVVLPPGTGTSRSYHPLIPESSSSSSSKLPVSPEKSVRSRKDRLEVNIVAGGGGRRRSTLDIYERQLESLKLEGERYSRKEVVDERTSSKYALQRPNAQVAGPRPRESSSSTAQSKMPPIYYDPPQRS
ncbi:hypothetical protein FRB99_005305 [Tulasnella sp. 403]|nr:hypothetical protein FRB99_005305 [Tulasnella sp. 403]